MHCSPAWMLQVLMPCGPWLLPEASTKPDRSLERQTLEPRPEPKPSPLQRAARRDCDIQEGRMGSRRFWRDRPLERRSVEGEPGGYRGPRVESGVRTCGT